MISTTKTVTEAQYEEDKQEDQGEEDKKEKYTLTET